MKSIHVQVGQWMHLQRKCVKKVEDMILHDRRVKVSVTAHKLGISAGMVSSIINSVLMMSKISSRWVPQMVTPEQKACSQKFRVERI